MLLAACATKIQPLPGPIDFPRSARSTTEMAGPAQRPTETVITPMPSAPSQAAASPSASTASPAPGVIVSGEDISMAIEQTPLPMFIQILYGNVLKKAYSIDPAVSARTDMVTFKTSQPIPRARMEQIAVNLLRSYNVTVQDYDGLVRVLPDSAPSAAAPILLRGKTLPNTPEPLRPIFQHVELDVVRSTDVMQWLKQMLGTRVTATDDGARNGLLLSGTQSDIRAALELIQSLDQPRMRGRVARRITPAYAAPTDFSTRLADMLTAQGYSVSTTANSNASSVLIVPIQAIGSVLVFTVSEETMEHVVRWAQELDRPPTGQTTNALFTYAVKYADAQDLARTLGELLGGGAPTGGAPAAVGTVAQARSTSNGRVVVNSATNTLIFRGSSADEYQQITTLLRELDRPTKSALIEVVVAELSTTDRLSLGVNWTGRTRTGESQTITGNAGAGGGGGQAAGLNLSIISDAGRLLTSINALASTNKARVLSNPRVVARNGEMATIQVGAEVPIVTSTQSLGAISGGILSGAQQTISNQIQYRSTGVILKVRPVINSGNRLDLEVSQEVSSANSTDTGVSQSPTISTRRVETKMSLRDGSTVILGGLISRNTGNGTTGIPWLKDIPLLGSLFRSQTADSDETEMLVMITPYVINDDYEAEAITDAVQKSFGDWTRDLKPSRATRPLTDAVSPALPGGVVPADRGVIIPAPVAPSAAPVGAQKTTPIVTRTEPALVPAQPTRPPTTPTAAPNDGVTMSRPEPAAAIAPKPGASAGAATPGSTPPAAVLRSGQEVTDPKVKEEIQRLLQKR